MMNISSSKKQSKPSLSAGRKCELMAKVNPKPFKFWITVTEIMKQLREIVQTREHRPHAAHETLSIT